MEDLPATAWAVLGELSFGRELSGYDIKKWADASLRFFYWSPAISQIYRELRRLEEVGYVTSREAAQDDLRNKRLYAITPAGRSALTEWVRHAPVELPVLKHGVMLRVWLGHLAAPDELRSVLDEHVAHAEAMMTEAGKAAESVAGDPDMAYPVLVNRWAERYYRAERDLAVGLQEDLARFARKTRRR